MVSFSAHSQTDTTSRSASQRNSREMISTETNKTRNTTEDETEDEGKYKRISFIAGVGSSYISRNLYADPVVNPTDNTVQIQSAGKIKTNMTLGVSYIFGKEGKEKVISSTTEVTGNHVIIREVGKRFQTGFTFALFVNPLLFNKITETQNFFNITDYGFGFGHTFLEGLAILGPMEFFSVSQPRPWFINQFKDKNLPYIIGNEPQKTIDPTDRNIFTQKTAVTFGIKFCYSFNTMKHFSSIAPAEVVNGFTRKSGGSSSARKVYF
jgi:hypothetical protein